MKLNEIALETPETKCWIMLWPRAVKSLYAKPPTALSSEAEWTKDLARVFTSAQSAFQHTTTGAFGISS